jgi:hypothetical protein
LSVDLRLREDKVLSSGKEEIAGLWDVGNGSQQYLLKIGHFFLPLYPKFGLFVKKIYAKLKKMFDKRLHLRYYYTIED